jgi:phenylalanyl-tRNA synthetase alpha subunit
MQLLTADCSYNPYTEPSMEIFSHHKGLNKLIEIGNSGIFRPEMLEVRQPSQKKGGPRH